MAYKRLALKSLLVNSANDRHGELENETAAIAWLFTHNESYMRNLAKDLVKTGQIYEPPLVLSSGANFIVFDGNRRVTCLKLLTAPKRAPSAELQQFFAELKAKWPGTLPQELVCQVEADREQIDEILLRRHTGVQGGVGRSPWTDRMMANFMERTGKGGGINVADEVEKRLKEAGMLPRKKIPWSTANRLLSSEGLRNRVGISVSKGKFQLTHDEALVLPVFRRVAEDLASKAVVLGDLWKTEGKQAYLDRLEAEGVLPLPALPLPVGGSSKGGVGGTRGAGPKPGRTPTPPRPPAPKPDKRTTLILQVDYGVVWQVHIQRQRQIWDELQFKLRLEDHPNAISVLFRVLFELATDNYIRRTSLASVHANDKLALKAQKIGADLLAKGKIDAKYRGLIRKLDQADGIFSLDTLNRYVHSPDFAPSPTHLIALWDQAAPLVVHCLNA